MWKLQKFVIIGGNLIAIVDICNQYQYLPPFAEVPEVDDKWRMSTYVYFKLFVTWICNKYQYLPPFAEVTEIDDKW